MTVPVDELIRVQYANIPGLDVIEGFAYKLLVMGIIFAVSVEIYRAITQGRCDLLTPLVRGLAAGILLSSLTEIGSLFDSTSRFLAGAIGDATTPALFADTWKRSVEGVSGIDFFGRWGFKVFFGLVSLCIFVLMFGLKFLIIDVIQPIRFSLALFCGLFAIPLGVWPKIGTLGAWLKQLAQISLWPVIFQFLLALSTSAFRSIFEEVGKLDLMAVLEGISKNGHGLDGPLITILKFLLLCCGYIYMTWQTPRIASSIVNSRVVDSVGGMMAAKMSSFAGDATAAVLKGPLASLAPYLGGAAAVAQAAGGSSNGAGGDGPLGNIAVSAGNDDQSSGNGGMNSRQHKPPCVEMEA